MYSKVPPPQQKPMRTQMGPRSLSPNISPFGRPKMSSQSANYLDELSRSPIQSYGNNSQHKMSSYSVLLNSGMGANSANSMKFPTYQQRSQPTIN